MSLAALAAVRRRQAQSRHWLVEISLYLLFAAVYLMAAKIGFRAAFVAEQVTAVWPPSGLGLWAMLFFGVRAWPAIWCGALVVNLTTGVPILPASVIAIGNTLEAVAGALLLRRLAGVDRSLEGLRHVTALIVAAAAFSPTISATLGVTALCVAKLQAWTQFGPLWWTWWLGDAAGILLVTPILLTTRFWKELWRLGRMRELLALEALAIGATLGVFALRISPLSAQYPLEYTVFLLVLWAGLRFAHPGAAVVSGTVSVIAIWGTLQGIGPFSGPSISPHDSVIVLQIYAVVMGISGLVLGAAIADRNRSERLRATNHVLASILSEEKDLRHATPRIIKAVCDTLEWDLGIFWETNEDRGVLTCVDSWQRSPRFDAFIDESRARRFESGIGLPGRVWSTAHPAWIYDVVLDTNFPRALVAGQLGRGFCLPDPDRLQGARGHRVLHPRSAAGGRLAAVADGGRRRANRPVHRTAAGRTAGRRKRIAEVGHRRGRARLHHQHRRAGANHRVQPSGGADLWRPA